MSQEIYVKEMPKSCAECEYCTKHHKDNYGISYCLIARMPLYNGDKIYEERGQHKDNLSDFDCPLKSLHDHDKELVERVLKEVEDTFTQYLPLRNRTGAWFYGRLNKILEKYKKGFEDD